MYGTDVQLSQRTPSRALARLEVTLHEPVGGLSTGVLLPGQYFLAWKRQKGRAVISRNTGLERLSVLEKEYLPWGDFCARCEPIPESDALGHNVWAQMRHDGPLFTLLGQREDMDGRDRDRVDDVYIDLEECRLICEVLATGTSRKLDRQFGGRLWKLEWTLQDLRSPSARRACTLAEQPLWFLPGFEDLTMFQMSCGELIRGFSREANWLLALPEQRFRAELNALIVLLDQATLRAGL